MEETVKGSNQVTLIADGERIICDKTKLKTASSYFGAMFNSDMIESNASEIRLKAVDCQLLRVLVHYAETDQMELEFTEQNAQALLQLACMMQFNAATSVLEQYLLENITHNNCCSILSLADNCGSNGLFNKARATAEWWFDDVSETEELLQLSYDLFTELVSSETLRISTELSVFKAVEHWLMHNYSERCKYLLFLLSCIHWGAISEAEFDNLVKASSLCQEDGVKNQVLDLWMKQNANETKPKPRAPQEALVVLGGEWIKADNVQDEEGQDKLLNHHVLVFETSKDPPNDHYTLTSLPEDFSNVWGYEACVVGKDIYLFGGEKRGPHMHKEWYKQVWCYDSLKNTWRIITELPTPRRHHSIAVNGNFVYVIGGFGRHRIIQNTVDRYDVINDTWEKQPPLAHYVFCPAACSCNGSIYVITNSIEVLHPRSNSWKQTSDILPPNVSIQSAISHKTDIYMIAIYISCFYLLDTTTEQLTKLNPFQHTVGKACKVNDKIFIVGGDDTFYIEYYSLQEQMFGTSHCQSQPIKDHHVVALPKFQPSRKIHSDK